MRVTPQSRSRRRMNALTFWAMCGRYPAVARQTARRSADRHDGLIVERHRRLAEEQPAVALLAEMPLLREPPDGGGHRRPASPGPPGEHLVGEPGPQPDNR